MDINAQRTFSTFAVAAQIKHMEMCAVVSIGTITLALCVSLNCYEKARCKLKSTYRITFFLL